MSVKKFKELLSALVYGRVKDANIIIENFEGDLENPILGEIF